MDLSADDPGVIAHLLVYMYFGHLEFSLGDKFDWQSSLVKLLNRSSEIMLEDLPSLATLAAAADKYQMPRGFVGICQAAYVHVTEELLVLHWEHIIPEFIESIKTIYQSAPSAGLRGRAITVAQRHLGELQQRKDFRDLMLVTPEFAVDIATKGQRQPLWCRKCNHYWEIGSNATYFMYGPVWDWIDYGEPQEWVGYKCKKCGKGGALANPQSPRDDTPG